MSQVQTFFGIEVYSLNENIDKANSGWSGDYRLKFRNFLGLSKKIIIINKLGLCVGFSDIGRKGNRVRDLELES